MEGADTLATVQLFVVLLVVAALVALITRRVAIPYPWHLSWARLDVEASFSPRLPPLPDAPPMPPELARLPVPEDAWYRTWAGYDLPIPDPGERDRRLPTDRDGLLELRRR